MVKNMRKIYCQLENLFLFVFLCFVHILHKPFITMPFYSYQISNNNSNKKYSVSGKSRAKYFLHFHYNFVIFIFILTLFLYYLSLLIIPSICFGLFRESLLYYYFCRCLIFFPLVIVSKVQNKSKVLNKMQ